jgi:RNA polymerase sigma factor (sigma-70 family)
MIETDTTNLIWKSPAPYNFAKSTPKAGALFLKSEKQSGLKTLEWKALTGIAWRVAKNFKLHSMTEEDRFQECICAIIVNLERIYAASKNPEALAYKVAHARLCRLYQQDHKLPLIPTSQMGNEVFSGLPSHLALEAIMPKDEVVSNFISTERLAAAVEHLRWTMQFLTDRQLQVVELAYGFNENEKELTYKEIGERLGLSSSRVGQVEKAAVQRLRQLFISKN